MSSGSPETEYIIMGIISPLPQLPQTCSEAFGDAMAVLAKVYGLSRVNIVAFVGPQQTTESLTHEIPPPTRLTRVSST